MIGYPYKFANEEDTLVLIDELLNSWGRYARADPTTPMSATLDLC